MVALSNRADHYIFMLRFVMVALCNRADHYIFALWFLSSSFFVHSLSLWKYLIACPTYNVAKSIPVNLDYRISGRRHSPGLYPTPHFHFRIPVTWPQTCTAWVYGKYLIDRPPYVVAKSIHLNTDYRISGRGHSPGLYPTPYFHFRIQ